MFSVRVLTKNTLLGYQNLFVLKIWKLFCQQKINRQCSYERCRALNNCFSRSETRERNKNEPLLNYLLVFWGFGKNKENMKIQTQFLFLKCFFPLFNLRHNCISRFKFNNLVVKVEKCRTIEIFFTSHSEHNEQYALECFPDELKMLPCMCW